MSIESYLRKKIVNFFIENIPQFQSKEGIEALLSDAGLEARIPYLDLNGEPKYMVSHVIDRLYTYGILGNGQNALIHFLTEIAKDETLIGLNHRETLQQFCQTLTERSQEATTTSQETLTKCPYLGLKAFQEADEKLFFGREGFTNKLFKAVQNYPIVSVIGPSGSGKSSAVFAGLVPRLRRRGNWLIVKFTPGINPFQELSTTLARLLEWIKDNAETFVQHEVKEFDPYERMIQEQEIQTDPFVEIKEKIENLHQEEPVFQEIVECILKKNPTFHLLVIADQFEELYTHQQDSKIRQQFLRELLSIEKLQTHQEPNFHLVITIRADFLNKALSDSYLANILTDSSSETIQAFSDKLLLSRMTLQELKAVIEQPAKRVSLQIEEGLTEHILEDIEKEAGNLPLLEFALTLLWEHCSGNKLTISAYKEIGQVSRAIATYAERIFAKFGEDERKRAQKIFMQLVQPGEGTENTRRISTRSEIGEESWNFATNKLAKTRLVVTDEAEKLTLVHEALIREWQRLQDWVEHDWAFLTWRNNYLRARVYEWEKRNYDEAILLRGSLLAEAEKWLKQRQSDLNQEDQKFITKSIQLQHDAEVGEIDALSLLASTMFLEDKEGALVKALEAAEKLRKIEANIPKDSNFSVRKAIYLRTVTSLQQAVYDLKREKGVFGDYTGVVLSVIFDQDGKLLASEMFNKMITIWDVEKKCEISRLVKCKK